MPGRDTCLGWPAAIGALALFACCGAAMAQGTPPPPAVSVIPVASRQVTETGEFLGRVTAIDKVDIVARVPGFIEERNFTEGQKVKTGDLLFRIEQATYKAAVEQQRANLAKAKATEVNAALQLERGKELVRNQNIPQSTLDQRAADDAAAQADVMEAQALLDQAQINLGYTEIRSPIDGRIGLANLHRRQSGRAVVRDPGDDRQPGSDLRDLSGERARRSRLQAQDRRVRRQEPACGRSRQAAQRQHLSASGPQQLPRRPGRPHDRHGGGARAIAEPGRPADPRRHRRRHGGTRARRSRR